MYIHIYNNINVRCSSTVAAARTPFRRRNHFANVGRPRNTGSLSKRLWNYFIPRLHRPRCPVFSHLCGCITYNIHYILYIYKHINDGVIVSCMYLYLYGYNTTYIIVAIQCRFSAVKMLFACSRHTEADVLLIYPYIV